MMSRWHREYRCVKCNKQVSWAIKMRGDGMCPYCGHFSDGTIMATLDKASEVGLATTIMKLKWVRFLLAPVLRLHIWLELRRRGQ
jgi:hypothetical protein